MAQTASEIMEPAAAIDRDHLNRMTFGDRDLAHEVLQLFDRQAALLIERMRGGDGALIGSLAHTLKGSAAGIGARHVAEAAQGVELAAANSSGAPQGDVSRAVDRLAAAVAEARVLIAGLLGES